MDSSVSRRQSSEEPVCKDAFSLTVATAAGACSAIGIRLTSTSLVFLTSAPLPCGELTARVTVSHRVLNLALGPSHSEAVVLGNERWLRHSCPVLKVLPGFQAEDAAAEVRGGEDVLADLPANASQKIIEYLVNCGRLSRSNGARPLIRTFVEPDVRFTDGRRVKQILVRSRVVLSNDVRDYETRFKVYKTGAVVAAD